MSKVDAQRAFREANYARRNNRAQPVDPPPAASASKPGPIAASASPAQADDQPSAAHALCGHRSMGNKSCSRPAGHPEKNHRYK